MLDTIVNNPFRILGVYANARPVDIVSNCDDMEAYLSVGQNVSFDLDFNNLMPAVKRTQETVAQAKSKINLPKDKLKYALFWFVKDSSSAHAMNYLKNGDFDNANKVFEIEDAFSTRINKAVVAMMQDDLGTAIANITEMIHDNDDLGLRDDFVKAICGDAFSIGEDEMAHLFINALLEEISAGELLELYKKHGVSKDDNNYLKTKAVDEPISRINAAISKAKSVRRDDADANYWAGKDLMGNTKSDLAKVKNLLGATNMQYQMLADDLADAIMQCGINYYNASEDNDKIENALGLQEYACKIAVGRLCKERCDKNLKALIKLKQDESVGEYIEAIRNALNAYKIRSNDYKKQHFGEKQNEGVEGLDRLVYRLYYQSENMIVWDSLIWYAITLIEDCAPFLIAIKENVGANNISYLNISTTVANVALNDVIETVNETQKEVDRRLRDYHSMMSIDGSSVRSMYIKAWECFLYIDKLDVLDDFKLQRYNPNKNSLKQVFVVNQISVESIKIYGFDMRTSKEKKDDEDAYNKCRSRNDYLKYLHDYPDGSYKEKAIRKSKSVFVWMRDLIKGVK